MCAEKEKVAKELRQSREHIRRLEIEAKVSRETIADLCHSKLQSMSSNDNTKKFINRQLFLEAKIESDRRQIDKRKRGKH